MIKALKILAIFILAAPSLIGCAPQRAKFTSKQPAKTSTTSSPVRPKLQPPQALTVIISDEQKTALGELIAALDVNSSRLSAGASRTMKRVNPVTRQLEHRVQNVLSVSGETAMVETRNPETGQVFPAREIRVDQRDPVEDAVRALAAGRNDELFSSIAGYLALFYDIDGAFPPDTAMEIVIRHAAYIDPSTFVLGLHVRIPESAAPKKFPPLAFEARLTPSVPRPFNVTRIAYGKGAPRQILLEVSELNVP